MTTRKDYLRGPRIDPRPITGKETVTELVDNAFLAYNAGRLAEGCRLFAERMLAEDVTVGMSLTGAMTPAGLGMSTMIPLIEAGFVDWIVSTGANLYHDAHFGLGLTMHRGTPFAVDVELREEGVVRIYDIFFDYEVLLSTDAYIREVSAGPEFQRPMSTAEYHYLLGGYILEREKALGISRKSVLGVAHQCAVPIYTSSPGDSSIGMNVAEQALTGSRLRFDPSADVNETSAIVFDAKTHGGKSGILIIGGGSPEKFVLQTEPQIQEGLGISRKGHDYYLQITHARAGTRGSVRPAAAPERVVPPPRGYVPGVRGVRLGAFDGHQSPQLHRPQRHLRAVRADQAGARPVGPAARLAGVRLRDRPLACGAAAGGARGPEVPACRDRGRRRVVECLHGAGRDGESLLAASRVPLPGGGGRGRLRAGGPGVAGGVLSRQAPRLRAGDLLGRHGLRRRARDLARRGARRAVRLAHGLRRPRRPRLSARAAGVPAARAAGSTARDDPRHRAELVHPWACGGPGGGPARRAAHRAHARRCGRVRRARSVPGAAGRPRYRGVRRLREHRHRVDGAPARASGSSQNDRSERGRRHCVRRLPPGRRDGAPHAYADLDVRGRGARHLCGQWPDRLGAKLPRAHPRAPGRRRGTAVRRMGARRRGARRAVRRPDGGLAAHPLERRTGRGVRGGLRVGGAGLRGLAADRRAPALRAAVVRDVLSLLVVQRAALGRDPRRGPRGGPRVGARRLRAVLAPRRRCHRPAAHRISVRPVRPAARHAAAADGGSGGGVGDPDRGGHRGSGHAAGALVDAERGMRNAEQSGEALHATGPALMFRVPRFPVRLVGRGGAGAGRS